MGLGEAIATVATAAVLIIMLLVGAEVFNRKLALKQRQLELDAERVAGQAGEQSAQMQLIEQRLRVLERIATDKGADLALQIEGLREAPEAAVTIEERSN